MLLIPACIPTPWSFGETLGDPFLVFRVLMVVSYFLDAILILNFSKIFLDFWQMFPPLANPSKIIGRICDVVVHDVVRLRNPDFSLRGDDKAATHIGISLSFYHVWAATIFILALVLRQQAVVSLCSFQGTIYQYLSQAYLQFITFEWVGGHFSNIAPLILMYKYS